MKKEGERGSEGRRAKRREKRHKHGGVRKSKKMKNTKKKKKDDDDDDDNNNNDEEQGIDYMCMVSSIESRYALLQDSHCTTHKPPRANTIGL